MEKSTVPGWVKILVGAGTIGLIAWKLPILEIASLFAYIVLVPLAFLSAIGLVGQGSVETFSGGFNHFMDELKTRVDKQRMAG